MHNQQSVCFGLDGAGAAVAQMRDLFSSDQQVIVLIYVVYFFNVSFGNISTISQKISYRMICSDSGKGTWGVFTAVLTNFCF